MCKYKFVYACFICKHICWYFFLANWKFAWLQLSMMFSRLHFIYNLNRWTWPCFSGILSKVRYCTFVNWTSHVLQGTRNTRPCITGHAPCSKELWKLTLINFFLQKLMINLWHHIDDDTFNSCRHGDGKVCCDIDTFI